MTTYDVLAESSIAATPAEIVQALLDEAAGRSQWTLRVSNLRGHTQIGDGS